MEKFKMSIEKSIIAKNKKIEKDNLYKQECKKQFVGKGESDLDKIRLQFTTLKEWEKRKDIIRKGILSGCGLSPLPNRTPLNSVIHSKREYNGYQVENVYFESIPGFYVTGSLYRPLPLQENMPILLKPHGHKANKRFAEENQKLCATFANMGVTVFTYDMVGYADSTQVKHKINSAFTLQTWNSIRSIDFVQSLPQVNKDIIGMTGGSGGATQTFMCAALDNRIKVSALVTMVSAFFYGGCVCESGLPIHKGDGYRTNNAEIAAITAPRPQLLVSVGTDWTRFTPVEEYPFIKSIYQLYGDNIAKLVENVHFPDEIHNYFSSKRQAVYPFFAKHFGIDINPFFDKKGLISEEFCVLEEDEKLHVFNNKYPRPLNAHKSEEAIIASLKKLQS